MNKIFSSLKIVTLFTFLFSSILTINSLAQNYWERTSGPGTVVVYDFVFKGNLILIGTFHGGMYKSIDEGETWQQIDNEFVSQSVYSLELLSNGNILAGTGSGIHISSDNGETWFHSALPDYLVSTITIDEVGSIYVGSAYENDIYRSTDNGLNWNPLNSGVSGIRSIVTKELNLILVACNSGTYRSSDSGVTWQLVFPPDQSINDLALNQSGNFGAISDFGHFYLSTDDGITWDSVSTINHSSRIIFSSSNGDLYLGSYGVHRSTNEGQTWTQLNNFQGSGLVRSIAENENSFFAGTYFGGVFRSTNYGTNWEQSAKGLNNSLVSIFEKDITGRILAGSNSGNLAVTTDDGENWSIISGLTQINALSASPNGSLFASQQPGVIYRSLDDGFIWSVVYQNIFIDFIQTVEVSPNETVFALINNKLNRSTDNGENWEEIEIYDEFEWITKISINSLGTIFTKTSDGYFRSTDNGESWDQLSTTPDGIEIFGITQTDKMYATASDSGYYYSTDYGNTWLYLSKGNGEPVRSFASNDIGYLFILEHYHTILRSTDNGISWQEINSGLDSVSLNCLIITDDDYLLVGASGKGVYRSINKTTSVENSFIQMPNVFYLEQNYPNPFNPYTKIRYQISNYTNVNLKVYDVLGNEVSTLVNQEKPAGIYEIEFQGIELSSGIYFYQLKAGNFIETRKMILLK